MMMLHRPRVHKVLVLPCACRPLLLPGAHGHKVLLLLLPGSRGCLLLLLLLGSHGNLALLRPLPGSRGCLLMLLPGARGHMVCCSTGRSPDAADP